jgi:MFS family permease
VVASGSDRLLLLAATSLFWFSHYTYVPILTPYAEHLGGSFEIIGFIVSAYGFSQLVIRLPLGIWSDRIGRRRPFVIAGLFAAAAAGAGLALSPSPFWMVVSRLVSGLSACAWVVFTVLYASYLPPGRTTAAMGELALVNGLSIMAASFLGGWLADSFGWTAPFWASAAFGLGGMGLCFFVHEARRRTPPRPFDIRAVIRHPGLLWASIVSAIGQYTVFATTFGFLPNYAVHIGATKTQLGLLNTVSLVFSSSAGFLAGRVTARLLGPRLSVGSSYLLTALATALVPFTTEVYGLFGIQALTGLARGTASTIMMTMAIHGLPDEERATAMGFYQAVYAFGMMLGPVAAGFIGGSTGFEGLFLSTAAVALLAAVVSTKLPRR